MDNEIKIFEGKQIRHIWSEEQNQWYLNIADVVSVLTDSADTKSYITKLKSRDKELAQGWGQIVTPLPYPTAGGIQTLNFANPEGIFRIIQSIPSKKAEPFKRWLARLGQERLEQMQDPEKDIEQAVRDYKRLGYSDKWINGRIRSIEVRKELTDEWKRSGVEEDAQFAALTDIISKAWSGKTTGEYKRLKGLHKESLRDNMTNIELALSTLAEATTTELSKQQNPQGFIASAGVAKKGGKIVGDTRKKIEKELGHTVITSQKAIDYIQPKDELPFPKGEENND